MPSYSLSEAKIVELKSKKAANKTAHSVILLASLYAKWRVSQEKAFLDLSQHVGDNIWIGSIIQYLDSWIDPNLSWKDALKQLIEEVILNQHDRIMYEKGKFESCWVERRDERLIKTQDYSPNWRSSRLINAILIMRDLSLASITDAWEVTITSEGKEVLDRILRESNAEATQI